MIKKILMAGLILALVSVFLYFGVMYGLIYIVLFISDVIFQFGSLIW